MRVANGLGEAPATLVPTEPAITGSGSPLAAFTVDVEDWYQSTIDHNAPVSERVVGNVDRILAMLDECGAKGTFFVQGLVARRFPSLLQTLVEQGHEVQSHGYSHLPLDHMDRATLERELDAARKSVEDAAGVPVTAFRAPDFSIGSGNLWALEVLAERGFCVDSSIFPVRMRRYGISGWKSDPQRFRFSGGAELLEVTVATWGTGRLRLPVGGGGYFRLLPLPILLRSLRACIAEKRPPVVYCHPYEFNGREMEDYRDQVAWSMRLHQGLGRDALVRRMATLLRALPFGRLDRVLATWGLA